ncbi:MAG: ribbon-helix-helix protein, CopG family [Bdellovibrionales bacterium]|nr:ribbon-helix-helix protein, CopG family [Bdellovibrionales bacterium]
MKKNTKSSITLPEKELKLVDELVKKLKTKTKVEVIRRGLKLLKESTDRRELEKAYIDAAKRMHTTTPKELESLDHLSNEGLD